jgi:hypothetical protein
MQDYPRSDSAFFEAEAFIAGLKPEFRDSPSDPEGFQASMDASLAKLESILPLPRFAAYPQSEDFILSDCASKMVFARIGGAPYSFSQASYEECCFGLGAEDILLDF